MKFEELDNKDIFYMKKAISIAEKGEGFVSPNPLVGCVIVKDNKIIGQGYHQEYGKAHAEVNAINNAIENLEGATLYVNLEPCSHYGKTPPCINKIVESKIKRVVISNIDPNPLVSGNGVKKLREHGIEVKVGVLENEGRKLNEIFFHYIKNKRPLCIVKSAVSLDGKIATKHKESKWISNEKSRYITHKYRHKFKGIMVGINTVLQDNPRLTCRLYEENVSNPIRIIIDSNLKIPFNNNLVKDKSAKTMIVTCSQDNKKINFLEKENIKIIKCPSIENHVDLNFVMSKLGELNIDSVLVEGGATLNDSLFRYNLVDKIKLFIAPKIIGGSKSPTFVSGEGIDKLCDARKLNIENVSLIDGDILVEAEVIK